jgi:hypothetical protein
MIEISCEGNGLRFRESGICSGAQAEHRAAAERSAIFSPIANRALTLAELTGEE